MMMGRYAYLMGLFDFERRRISLRPCTQKRAMRQIGCSDLCTSQMFNVLKVQIVIAIVEHVNHFMRKDSLHHSFTTGNVLAYDNLIEFGIVASANRNIADFTRYMPSNVHSTVGTI